MLAGKLVNYNSKCRIPFASKLVNASVKYLRARKQTSKLKAINITAVDLKARKKLIEVVKMARGSMSQRAFGKLLGVSATAVQLWEKGESIPDTENLANIAARAGYTMEELLNFLGVKPVSESSDVNQIVKYIKSMPLSEVAIIGRAVMDRLATAAEASIDEVKAS